MSVFAVRLPDVGEGVAEAELVEWHVSVGDSVTTESVLAEVLTDKATIEISSPVTGTVTYLRGEPGEKLAVGSELVGIELDGGAEPATAPPPQESRVIASAPAPAPAPAPASPPPTVQPERRDEPGSRAAPRPMAAPTVRHRARELGIDLNTVRGSGPHGRIVHADLDRLTATSPQRRQVSDVPRVEPVRGLRRRIAERLTQSWTEIPHITYVDEVDATEVEALRSELNRREQGSGRRLTLLPFIVRGLVIACREQPRLNATYDAAAGSLSVFDAMHVGIATQTPDGLVVPVVRHAESLGLWELAGEIGRLADAARAGNATRDELSGSTITITSLGALGGLVTTPIINQPEVAIIGVNKLETRPVWRDGAFVPRAMFNLSSSFDHRIIDGWDAATFVQRLKALLEMPALMFMDDAG
jgi:2-oxoisovalerate dehydrogenase E2 component (dihydrolipoyl transacylase)